MQAQQHARADRRRSGFTLMEVALAVVVVGIGVLGLFALISAGLDSSAKAIAETQAAFFADAVFNGLRSKCLNAATNDTEWFNILPSNPRNYLVIPVPCWPAAGSDRVWADASTLYVTNGISGTALLKNRSLRNSRDTQIEHVALRYLLQVVRTDRGPVNGKTYAATLWVLPGEFPRLASWDDKAKADATVFYSEFPRMGTF